MVIATSDTNVGLSRPWAWAIDSVEAFCLVITGGFLPLRNLYDKRYKRIRHTIINYYLLITWQFIIIRNNYFAYWILCMNVISVWSLHKYFWIDRLTISFEENSNYRSFRRVRYRRDAALFAFFQSMNINCWSTHRLHECAATCNLYKNIINVEFDI